MTQRIADVRAHRVELALRREFTTAVRSTSTIHAVIVEVRDGEGGCGWGEATANWQVTGESVEGILAALTGPLKAAVLGRIPDEIIAESVVAGAVAFNHAARSALDCAVHDLAARQVGRTLRDHLAVTIGSRDTLGAGVTRGSSAHRVRTDMTLSAGEPQAVVRAAKEAAGFSHIKIKVGGNPAHVQTVISVREALGPRVHLRVDANQAWDATTAIHTIRRWEDAGVGVEFVEQPTPARDTRALAQVSRNVDTPVVADEGVRDRYDLDRIPPGVAVNIKLAKAGGLTPALELAAEAQASGRGILMGCMMESPIGLAPAAALASVIDDGTIHDLDAGLWLQRTPVTGGITYTGDQIHLDPGPGTGITGLESAGGESHAH